MAPPPAHLLPASASLSAFSAFVPICRLVTLVPRLFHGLSRLFRRSLRLRPACSASINALCTYPRLSPASRPPVPAVRLSLHLSLLLFCLSLHPLARFSASRSASRRLPLVPSLAPPLAPPLPFPPLPPCLLTGSACLASRSLSTSTLLPCPHLLTGSACLASRAFRLSTALPPLDRLSLAFSALPVSLARSRFARFFPPASRSALARSPPLARFSALAPPVLPRLARSVGPIPEPAALEAAHVPHAERMG